MLKERFVSFIEDLSQHFGKPRPDYNSEAEKAQLRSWFEAVQEIPDEALAWVLREMKRELNYFPHNPCKPMLDGWEKWKKEHPAKVIDVREEDYGAGCPFCSRGLIAVERQQIHEDGTPVSWRNYIDGKDYPMIERQAFGCGHCRVRQGRERMMTHEQIEAAGWTICTPDLAGMKQRRSGNKFLSAAMREMDGAA